MPSAPCACLLSAFRRKMADYASLQRSGSEKTPQFFSTLLHAEYVTIFSGRTDAPEVRCDRSRHTCTDHVRRGLIWWTCDVRSMLHSYILFTLLFYMQAQPIGRHLSYTINVQRYHTCSSCLCAVQVDSIPCRTPFRVWDEVSHQCNIVFPLPQMLSTHQ